MANLNNSKIIVGSEVLMDLTADTVTPENLLRGKTAHNKAGAPIVGTCDYDSNTTNDTASADEILVGQTAHAGGALVTGSMPNNGAVHLELQGKNTPVQIPQGYHDGSGIVAMNAADAAKLIPENIRQGVEILDVVGSMTGTEDVKLTTGSVTPSLESQVVLPPDGFHGYSQLTVEAIPITRTENAAGGITVTIG